MALGQGMIIYGIPTCDTCRKAQKALEAAGHEVRFRDIRAQPLSAAEWAPLLAEFGDTLVNRSSTTWRGLNDWTQASEAEVQLSAHPAVMKRPVIAAGGKLYLGWTPEVQAALL